MRRGLYALALLLVACASSFEIERQGYEHAYRADAAEARGDYERAARERAVSYKLLAKARRRAYEEAWYGYPY